MQPIDGQYCTDIVDLDSIFEAMPAYHGFYHEVITPEHYRTSNNDQVLQYEASCSNEASTSYSIYEEGQSASLSQHHLTDDLLPQHDDTDESMREDTNESADKRANSERRKSTHWKENRLAYYSAAAQAYEEKKRENWTPYWCQIANDEPQKAKRLVKKVMNISGLKLKAAKTHLQLNLNAEIENDLMSKDATRERKAIHMLDYGLKDKIFTSTERKKIATLVSRKDGAKYGSPSRVLSRGCKYLTEEEKIWIKTHWDKSDKILEKLAQRLCIYYRCELSLQTESYRGRKKNPHVRDLCTNDPLISSSESEQVE